MHTMSLLLNTCSGMTNRVLIDDGARLLAATTSGRAKELVKQGLSDRSGMIALRRIRERIRQDHWSGEALRRVSVSVDIF